MLNLNLCERDLFFGLFLKHFISIYIYIICKRERILVSMNKFIITQAKTQMKSLNNLKIFLHFFPLIYHKMYVAYLQYDCLVIMYVLVNLEIFFNFSYFLGFINDKQRIILLHIIILYVNLASSLYLFNMHIFLLLII